MRREQTVLPATALFRAVYVALLSTVFATFDGRIVYQPDPSIRIPPVWLQLVFIFVIWLLPAWGLFALLSLIWKKANGKRLWSAGEGNREGDAVPMPLWLGGLLLSLCPLAYTCIRGALQQPFLGYSLLFRGAQCPSVPVRILICYAIYVVCYWVARLGDLWIVSLLKEE